MKLTVTMDATEPQALALQAMFDYWNLLAGIGSSRKVAFVVDGDGDFHPHAKMTADEPLPTLTDEMRQRAVVFEHDGDRVYDYDPIAWALHD